MFCVLGVPSETLPFRNVESSSHSSKLFIRRRRRVPFFVTGIIRSPFCGLSVLRGPSRGPLHFQVGLRNPSKKPASLLGIPPQSQTSLRHMHATYQTKVQLGRADRSSVAARGFRRRRLARQNKRAMALQTCGDGVKKS